MKFKLLAVLIFILAFVLRFHALGQVPAGLTNDEADIGYDAYSILLTGKDQWDVFLPPTGFRGFGDYRPSIYTYLTVPSVAIFGLNEFAVRFPSALFGFFSVILIYFLAKNIAGEKLGLMSAFLFAISPWNIGLSRIGIESNVAITFLLLGLFFFFSRNKNGYNLYLSVIFFLLTIHTYSAYTLFIPLLFIVLIYFYKKESLDELKKHKRRLIIIFLLVLIFFIPIFQKDSLSAGVRFSQISIVKNINSLGLLDSLNDQIGTCLINHFSLLCKIVNNKPVLFFANFFKNYFSHFSFNFLYITGTVTQYSILPARGLEFLFEATLLIIGVITIITKRKKEGFVLLAILLISAIPDSLTGDGHYSRASIMLPFLILTEAVGFLFLIKIMQRIKIINLFISIVLFIAIAFSLFAFMINYLTYFKIFYSHYSQYGYKSLMTRVYSERTNYDRIYISKHLNDTKHYIYYLFFNKYNPLKFQKKVEVSYKITSDGWVSVERIDNIYFVENVPSILPNSDLAKKRILLISNPVDFPMKLKQKNLIKDKRGTIMFKEVELKDLLRY